jgi:hypothetical protein
MNSRSRPGSVDYMVDRICEPILSTRFASSELCRSLQDENRAYADLIDHLGTLTRNAMRLPLRGTHRFTLYSTPHPIAGGHLQLAPRPSRPRVSSNSAP